jgi:hypothetical protein
MLDQNPIRRPLEDVPPNARSSVVARQTSLFFLENRFPGVLSFFSFFFSFVCRLFRIQATVTKFFRSTGITHPRFHRSSQLNPTKSRFNSYYITFSKKKQLLHHTGACLFSKSKLKELKTGEIGKTQELQNLAYSDYNKVTSTFCIYKQSRHVALA